MLGQYSEAKSKNYDALNIYKSIVGETHPSYATTLHNLGVLEKDQANLDESLSGMERVQILESSILQLQTSLNLRQKIHGEQHPDTIATMTNLGSAMATQLFQDLEVSTKHNKSKRKLSSKSKKNGLQLKLI